MKKNLPCSISWMLFVLYSPSVPNQACQYWYYCQVWVSVPILRKKKLWLSWHDQAGMCYYLPLLPKSPTQTDVFHFLKASYWSTLLALQVNTEVTYLDCNNTCMLLTSREVRLGKTVPEVLDTARGRRPRVILKAESTVSQYGPNYAGE